MRVRRPFVVFVLKESSMGSMARVSGSFFVCFCLFLLSAGCGGDGSSGGVGESSGAEPDVSSGSPSGAESGEDASSVGPGSEDVGGGSSTSGLPDVGSGSGVGGTTSGGGSDPGSGPESGPESSGVAGTGTLLADYIPCSEDVDCPVGFGNCVRELVLNRVGEDGVRAVAVRDLAPEWPEEGVCSLVCTGGSSVCNALSSVDGEGNAYPWSCRLVVSGEGSYRGIEAETGEVTDPDAMALGVPFAALCRPPFERHPAHDSAHCSACGEGTDGDCAGGMCWDFLMDAEAVGVPGTCLRSCDEERPCAYGEACVVLGGGEERFCRPLEDTCTYCRDLDGDGFGTGLCDGGEGPTAEDCDDRDAGVYFDADDPLHPFPATCEAGRDRNCSGVEDAVEQVGLPEHCEACGDDCTGAVPQGVLVCAREGATPGVPGTCRVECTEEGWVNCDGDPRTGCEANLGTDGGVLRWPDCDGDGFGDASRPFRVCEGTDEVIVEGRVCPLVDNGDDCDDGDDEVFPGAPEQCNGVDNSCNGHVDMGGPAGSPTPLVRECYSGPASTRGVGICEDGVETCTDGSWAGVCDGEVRPVSSPRCDGRDDNCDGTVDSGVNLGGSCEVSGQQGACRVGEPQCQNGRERCTQVVQPASFSHLGDEDITCDGFRGTLAHTIFVAGASGEGNGSWTSPFSSLERALEAAEARRTAQHGVHIVLDATHEYEIPETWRQAYTGGRGIALHGGFVFDPQAPTELSSRWVLDESQKARVVIRATDNGGVTPYPEVAFGFRMTGIREETRWTNVRIDVELAESRHANRPAVLAAGHLYNSRGMHFDNVEFTVGEETLLPPVFPPAPEPARDGANGSDARVFPNNAASFNMAPAPPPGFDFTRGQAGHVGCWSSFGALPNRGTCWQELDNAGDNPPPIEPPRSATGTCPGIKSRGTIVMAENNQWSGLPSMSCGTTAGGGEGGQSVWNAAQSGDPGGAGFSGMGGGSGIGGFLFAAGVAGGRGPAGGSGGNGGIGGHGGGGGAPGMTMAGIFLRRANAGEGSASFSRSRLTVASGVDGGRGGDGQVGGQGGAGGGPDNQGSLSIEHSALWGGPGASGAGGGGGGGGGGGWSIGLLHEGDYALPTSDQLQVRIGSPGQGGGGGSGGAGGEGRSVDRVLSGANIRYSTASGPGGENGGTGQSGQTRLICVLPAC
ncbi:MAG: hypothetical protein EA398_08235 [Deltaproteobacteria bacterium]|nr:MAG: hypothetical protein EA398_08235 [Deltaproteobacteria bacterium]